MKKTLITITIALSGILGLSSCINQQEIEPINQEPLKYAQEEREIINPIQGMANYLLLTPLNRMAQAMRKSYLENGGTLARPKTYEERFR
jgi:uncharacterized alpha/beta hydrolase family protein